LVSLEEVVENRAAAELAAEHLAGAGDKDMHILIEIYHMIGLGVVKFLKKLSVCVAVLFVIVTVVSLCVMNFTPINRLLGGYKEQPLDLSRADGANITYNDDGTITLWRGLFRDRVYRH